MMNKSETIGNLAEALSKAQGEIDAAKMNSVNPFLKNRYADLGSVIEAARPALAKHGLSFSQMIGGDAQNVVLETVLMHASGEYISQQVSLPVGEEKGRSLAQNVGAIVTYLRRYSLSAMLGIYADEDTDGQQTESKKQQPQAQPKQEQAQQEHPQHAQNSRPLAPEKLKEMIAKRAAEHQGKAATIPQRGLFTGMMDAMFTGDADRRHTVQAYLFGADSTLNIPDNFIIAGLDWIKATKDTGGAYAPDPMSIKEAQAAYTAALADKGQDQLL